MKRREVNEEWNVVPIGDWETGRPANDQVYQLVDGNCRFWAIYQLFNLIDRPIDSHENDFWDVSETLNEALETDTKLCENGAGKQDN